MKKIILITTVLLGFLSINSCSEEDLGLVNPNTLSPDTFFSTEEQVQSAVNAAYANMQPHSLYGRLVWYMLDNMSQENAGNGQQEADKRTFAEYTYDSTNQFIADYWDSCYRGVNKANFVLNNEDRINEISDAIITPQRKRKFLGEAHFLRAYYYWLLVNRFGDIPKRIDGSTPEGLPRSPKSEIIDLIIEDLQFAAANLLPKAQEQKGRANLGAAQAFLGKVLLYERRYGEALTSFRQMSGYGLETDYFDNFREETEHGIESVFEVEYNINLGTGNKWDNPNQATGANHATFRGQDYGVLNWFNVYPSDDLRNEFEAGDNRFQGSFYVVGDTYNNGNNTFVEGDFAENGGNIRPAAWKKYQNYYKQTSENEESGINAKIIRYSDVLLMMAECENEVGSQSAAVGLINQVRARAGLADLATTLSKDQVFQAIIHERKVELAGEQVRFDDLLRWGLAGSVLPGLSDNRFDASKHILWPIPDNEISTNANIGPADQNPGY
ncbi:RagB/SusD family nutrient uptake outer membrane protein [Aquimarina sp. D1M17]|uniref:RagB/SusD family nutrient uptake outer membrane protein n=1 Tax=Aquimarina acroporae TaxID=2937283 RepID=UPI0020BE50AA|nr:RagB/SusD family nutrient uptake outer membrane protein [Aquimarina acroporae]MCK8521766.1 RagB/SusD family nutrient uptake outer membrane protein [Aquimarina acroporae]